MKLLFCLALAIVAPLCCAMSDINNLERADETGPIETLYGHAGAFLAKNSGIAAERIWARRFTERVETRAQDSGVDIEQAAVSIIREWAVVRLRELTNPETATLTTLIDGCRMFRWFIDRSYRIPEVEPGWLAKVVSVLKKG